MSKKIISILLALSMMSTMLAACNQNDQPVEPNNDPEEIQDNNPVEEPIDDGTLEIIVDGISEYVIVRGENASPSEITAASELQSYLKQISGAELAIVTDAPEAAPNEIIVGKTNREADGEFDRTELGDDGFVIKTNNGKLWLVGGEQRGTLYSVYTFLENYLGCRFYTADFEKVPEQKTISLKIDEDKQIPVFETRNSFWYDMYNHNLSAKLKINCRRGRGDLPAELGGSLSWAGGECHTLYSLAEMTGDHMWNEPCLTSDDVYNTVLKNVRALLDANPNAKFVSISQNDSDNRREGCECENCMAVYNKYGCWTGPYLEFVNRIARVIKEEYPDVMIHTFAYRFTRLVPEGLVPEDNVMVQLCTIEADFRHPLEDYKERTPEEKYDYIDDFAALLKDWSNVCNYLSVWDYTTDFGEYSMTFANFDSLRQNIRLFADNNVKNLFIQGGYQSKNGEFGELRGYIIARLLWNPYMTEEEYWAMIDEFLLDYYGPGGVHIREYIDLVLAETADISMGCGIDPLELYPSIQAKNHEDGELPTDLTYEDLQNPENIDWTKYQDWYSTYTPSIVLTKGYELFNAALEKAETDEQRARIDKCMIQVEYLDSYCRAHINNTRITNITKIIRAIASEHLSNKDLTVFTNNIVKNIRASYNEEYYSFNLALVNKMRSYNIWMTREGGHFPANENLNLNSTPEKWY